MDTTRTSAYWYRGGFGLAGGDGLGGRPRLVGLLFTSVDWFTGPLASTPGSARTASGWAATIVVAGVLYAVLPRTTARPGGAGGLGRGPRPATIWLLI